MASDLNPGNTVLASQPAVTRNVNSVQVGDSKLFTSGANSNNHKNTGQNVLYGDGHVDFQQTPFCGTPAPVGSTTVRDNIFTAVNAARTANGSGGTTKAGVGDIYDSILLPTEDVAGNSGM